MTPYKNKKVPGYLHQDVNDPTRMFFLGQIYNRAAVIKFAKRNMNVDWRLEI
jgi:hypothetical protein